MNAEDKQRFARYKKGYIEPSIIENSVNINSTKTNIKINTNSKHILGHITNNNDIESMISGITSEIKPIVIPQYK